MRLQVMDLFFRPLFAFFIIELQSRKVIHVHVTRTPTDLWVAQQLREATPYGERPRYLLRDNDRKFGPSFARVAITTGIKVLRTPLYRLLRTSVAKRGNEQSYGNLDVSFLTCSWRGKEIDRAINGAPLERISQVRQYRYTFCGAFQLLLCSFSYPLKEMHHANSCQDPPGGRAWERG